MSRALLISTDFAPPAFATCCHLRNRCSAPYQSYDAPVAASAAAEGHFRRSSKALWRRYRGVLMSIAQQPPVLAAIGIGPNELLSVRKRPVHSEWNAFVSCSRFCTLTVQVHVPSAVACEYRLLYGGLLFRELERLDAHQFQAATAPSVNTFLCALGAAVQL